MPPEANNGESPMAARKSCSCCHWYNLTGYCWHYAGCKGSLFGGSSYWQYDAKVEQESLERIAAMERSRG
jgi:hypothetical protein